MKLVIKLFILTLGNLQIASSQNLGNYVVHSDKTNLIQLTSIPNISLLATKIPMNDRSNLLEAEQKEKRLFDLIEKRGLIVPGKSEKQLNDEVVKIAHDEFGVDKFWHKKIVRAGVNTQLPYGANPVDLVIKEDDIVILDFGPIFNGWESDVARTYVLGNDVLKLKIKRDVEEAWNEANAWYKKQTSLTGAVFFNYIKQLAKRYGYEFGGEIAGHIVGRYPHEQVPDGDMSLDIHPGNNQDMFKKDANGVPRNWILEMHFVDRVHGIGGYTEQLLK